MRSLAWIPILLVVLAGESRAGDDLFIKHDASTEVAGEPSAESALVYVIRPSRAAFGVRTWAFVDDRVIGVSRARGYAFAHVAPGEHIFWSKAENVSAVKLEVEAGETYYFQQKIKPGIGKARVKLVPVDPERALEMLGKSGWAELTAAGRERGAEIVAKSYERAQRKAEKR